MVVPHQLFQNSDPVLKWFPGCAWQDTLVAMEALYEFANQDKNRNIFNLDFNIKSTSSPGWAKSVSLRKEFYTFLTKDCVS